MRWLIKIPQRDPFYAACVIYASSDGAVSVLSAASISHCDQLMQRLVLMLLLVHIRSGRQEQEIKGRAYCF